MKAANQKMKKFCSPFPSFLNWNFRAAGKSNAQDRDSMQLSQLCVGYYPTINCEIWSPNSWVLCTGKTNCTYCWHHCWSRWRALSRKIHISMHMNFLALKTSILNKTFYPSLKNNVKSYIFPILSIFQCKEVKFFKFIFERVCVQLIDILESGFLSST